MVGDGAGLKGRVEGGVIQGTEHAGWGGTLRWAGGGRGGAGGGRGGRALLGTCTTPVSHSMNPFSHGPPCTAHPFLQFKKLPVTLRKGK